MTRQRWFCAVCGALTINPAERDGRAYCRAHSDLPALDEVAPDPLESLPVTAQETTGHRSWCSMLSSNAPGGRYCNCGLVTGTPLGVTERRAIEREDATPAAGTEA